MAAMMGQSGADDRRAAERARLVVEGHDAALAVGMGGRGRELALIRSVQDQVMQIVLKKYFAVGTLGKGVWGGREGGREEGVDLMVLGVWLRFGKWNPFFLFLSFVHWFVDGDTRVIVEMTCQ